jgi:glutaredoxin
MNIMRMHYKVLPAVFIILILPLSVFAEIYKWTDSSGNTFFSDSPPPGVKAQKMKIREERMELPERPEIKNDRPEKSSEIKSKRSYRDINVIMYMTSWCRYCRKAREYINSLGANLIEYDIDKDKNKEREMTEKSGSTGVPLIDVEGILIRGFSAEEIKEAVERKRSL